MGYHELTLNPAVSRKFLTALEENDPPLPLEDGDFLVARGMSGLHRGTLASLAWNLPLFVLRKPTDTDHHDSYGQAFSHMWLDGKAPPGSGRAIFVDDFICSGDTFRKLAKIVGPIEGIVLLGSWGEPDEIAHERDVHWVVVVSEDGRLTVSKDAPFGAYNEPDEMGARSAADPEGTDVLQGDPKAPF